MFLFLARERAALRVCHMPQGGWGGCWGGAHGRLTGGSLLIIIRLNYQADAPQARGVFHTSSEYQEVLALGGAAGDKEGGRSLTWQRLQDRP